MIPEQYRGDNAVLFFRCKDSIECDTFYIKSSEELKSIFEILISQGDHYLNTIYGINIDFYLKAEKVVKRENQRLEKLGANIEFLVNAQPKLKIRYPQVNGFELEDILVELDKPRAVSAI